MGKSQLLKARQCFLDMILKAQAILKDKFKN